MAWLSSQHLSQWAYCDNSEDIGIRIGDKGVLCASRGFQRITGSQTPAVSASAGHNLWQVSLSNTPSNLVHSC